MTNSAIDTAPWWLPADWQAVGLAILGGVVITQIAKLAYRDATGRKPKRYLIVALSVVVTVGLITLITWLGDVSLKASLRSGLMWGAASPILWIAAQAAMRRWTPGLAATLGENRRRSGDARDSEQWTPEQRENFRKQEGESDPTLFGDTTITKRNNS